MNGIDPIAIATGNDWRAIEAGAHAYAARSGTYRGLTDWSCGDDGALIGTLELPLKPGIVGASVAANPGAALALRIIGVHSASELAGIMAAVGLAQNFSAIRALATEGIQRGHMRLHARSVVAAAEVPAAQADVVTQRLIDSGEIKQWKAREIYAELADRAGEIDEAAVSAAGKIILCGEHAVVHGRHAIALPLPDAMRAAVHAVAGRRGIRVRIPAWAVDHQLLSDREGADAIVRLIVTELNLSSESFEILIHTPYPRGAGLGGSASFAVVVTRALSAHFDLGLTDRAVNELAFRSEQIAHGNASGIDNTVATYAEPLIYRRGDPPSIGPVSIAADIELVVCIGTAGRSTAVMVDSVAQLRSAQPAAVDRVFDDIDALVLEMRDALASGDRIVAGRLLNLNHGLLNALGVSTPELERKLAIARNSGAYGAKLTGAGGGGAIIALSDGERSNRIVKALALSGSPVFRIPIIAKQTAAT